MPKRTIWTLVLISLGILPTGCKPQEQIDNYRIPRTTAPREPVDAEEIASQFDHILVAVVPQGNQAWFFKLSGPAEAIDRQRDAFHEFLSTVTVEDSSDQPPEWQTPAGWEERPASQMRAATLVIPDQAGPLELAVSSLPLGDDWANFLTINVNRWMGQLGQPGLDEATIAELSEKIDVKGGSATVVELVGRMSKPAMGGSPHAAAQADGPQEQASSEQPEQEHLTYETPEGWHPGRVSAMRKAAFRLVEGDSAAEVTVIDLPASGGSHAADVQANVRRWAGQVGLTELDSEELEELIQPIAIDGVEGHYAELTSPADTEPPRAMLVAMVVRQGKVWFIKMFGERALVQGQSEAFQAFLRSIKFK